MSLSRELVKGCQGNKAAAIKSHVTSLDKKDRNGKMRLRSIFEVENNISALRYSVVNIQFIGLTSREIPC